MSNLNNNIELSKKVTVLIPNYNSGKYIGEAIRSILNQTYKDFSILVIDDNSTDDSLKIVESFNDNRIKIIKNINRIGLVNSLNMGIEQIDSQYILRMDSDDIAHKNRIKEQIKYMDSNPNIVVSGASINLFRNDSLKKSKLLVETNTNKINILLFFECPLMHPTVILRKDILKNDNFYYDANHKIAEDLGLWVKISKTHKIGNIKKTLLDYRVVQNSKSRIDFQNKENSKIIIISIYRTLFLNNGINIDEKTLEMYVDFINGNLYFSDYSINEIDNLNKIFIIMKKRLKNSKFIDSKLNSLYRLNQMNIKTNFKEFQNIHNEKFKKGFKLSIISKLIYFYRVSKL